MTLLLIATGNAHKVAEIRQVLGDPFQYATLRDFPGAPAVPETGATFEANARLKAEGIARWLLESGLSMPGNGCAVLADDSGLEVDALNGAPGVHSARFAASEFGLAGNAPDAANNAKLLRLLADVPPERRTARFRCALAFAPVAAQPRSLVFEGHCEGRIGFLPRGRSGFGYDPLFLPHGHAATFAELGEETKNTISHRARALESLSRWLRGLREGPPPDSP